MIAQFNLIPLLKERNLSQLELTRQITEAGFKANPNAINSICNNTSIRISLVYIQYICYVLQVSPASWIICTGKNPESNKIATRYTTNKIINNLEVRLFDVLQEQDKTMRDLLDYLDQQAIKYREQTLFELANNQLKQLPVYLILPITEFLGVSIDEWLYMKYLNTPRAAHTLFSLDQLMNDRGFDSLEVVHALEDLNVFVRQEDIDQLRTNTLSYIPKDLLAGICVVFNVELQDWITVRK